MCNCKVSDTTLRKIGLFLIILAVIAMIFGVICLSVCISSVKYGAGPLWTGAFVVFSGLCAYKSGHTADERSKRCWLNAFLTFDIISIVLTFVGWCLAIAGTADDSTQYHHYNCGSFLTSSWEIDRCDDPKYDYRTYQISISINSINLVLAFIECVTTFAFSIVACCAMCNTQPAERHTVVYQTTTGRQAAIVLQPGQQLVPAGHGQGMMIVNTVPTQPQAVYPVHPQPMQGVPVQHHPQVAPYPLHQPPTQPTAPPVQYNEPPPAYDSIHATQGYK
ncbi:uncharacterized protein LOC144451344 [Glandiceps talaboti]